MSGEYGTAPNGLSGAALSIRGGADDAEPRVDEYLLHAGRIMHAVHSHDVEGLASALADHHAYLRSKHEENEEE